MSFRILLKRGLQLTPKAVATHRTPGAWKEARFDRKLLTTMTSGSLPRPSPARWLPTPRRRPSSCTHSASIQHVAPQLHPYTPATKSCRCRRLDTEHLVECCDAGPVEIELVNLIYQLLSNRGAARRSTDRWLRLFPDSLSIVARHRPPGLRDRSIREWGLEAFVAKYLRRTLDHRGFKTCPETTRPALLEENATGIFRRDIYVAHRTLIPRFCSIGSNVASSLATRAGGREANRPTSGAGASADAMVQPPRPPGRPDPHRRDAATLREGG